MFTGNRALATSLIIFLLTLSACGRSGPGRLAGHWLNMADGTSVEFRDGDMKAADGNVVVVDEYKTQDNSVIVVVTKDGKKEGTTYTFAGDDRICTGDTLNTCLVRAGRAGKLAGTWTVGEHKIHLTDDKITFDDHAYPIQQYTFDGDRAFVTLRVDGPTENVNKPTSPFVFTAAPRVSTRVFLFDGPDKIEFLTQTGAQTGLVAIRNK